MACIEANCDKIAVENPVGIMNTAYRQPDQIIEPYMFVDSVDDKENFVTKRTCLWLKGLAPLEAWQFERPDNSKVFGKYSNGKNKTWADCFARNGKDRSVTFPGVAKAMAEQWG